MAGLGVCLVLAAVAAEPIHGPAFVATERFTLAWTHSIEKVRWEEDYAVVATPGRAAPPELRALSARVKGSGAGMEPPPDAVLKDGWYSYTPTQRAPGELRLLIKLAGQHAARGGAADYLATGCSDLATGGREPLPTSRLRLIPTSVPL